LPDGDILVVHEDCPDDWLPGGRIAILGHGMGGSSRSPLMVRLAAKLIGQGVRVFRYDMRGCGAGMGLAHQPYHAGRSDDLAAVVHSVLKSCQGEPTPSIALVGVSLSGNILLKYLGETADRVPSAVTRAIAINPPIDLARSVAALGRLLNRGYDRYFVGALCRHLMERQRLLPSAPMPTHVFRPRRLEEFDNQFTAPFSGFASGAEYYQQCSANQFLSRIEVPTMVITSSDDPLVPVEMFHKSRSTWSPHMRLCVTPGGGHVGYFAQAGIDPDPFWLDWRIMELVTAA